MDNSIEALTQDTLALMAIIDRTEECGDCYEWQGATNGAGHPKTENQMCRRMVWVRVYGELRACDLVTTKCENSLCVNAAHLVLTNKAKVARKSNARHAVKLKRAASSARTNRAGLGKITMDLAREIRASNKQGKDWAAELGVSAALISHVRCNRSWVEFSNPFAGLMA